MDRARGCTAPRKSKHRLTYEVVLDYREASGVTGRNKQNEHAGSHAVPRIVLENPSSRHGKLRGRIENKREERGALGNHISSAFCFGGELGKGKRKITKAPLENKTQIYYYRSQAN